MREDITTRIPPRCGGSIKTGVPYTYTSTENTLTVATVKEEK